MAGRLTHTDTGLCRSRAFLPRRAPAGGVAAGEGPPGAGAGTNQISHGAYEIFLLSSLPVLSCPRTRACAYL